MPAREAHAPTSPEPSARTRGPAEAPRILIVRPSALGDVSRSVPALVTLRKAFPHAQIDWLVSHAFADVIAHHPMLSNVLRYDRQWFPKLFRGQAPLAHGFSFSRRLRTNRYDAVYDLQGLFRSGVFTWLTRSPRRVGFANARELAWLGYNVRHPVDGEVRHTVDRMLALLERDGLHPVRDLRLYLGPDDDAWLGNFLHEHALTPGAYACLAPTARWGSKCWPLDRYAEIARRLLQAAGGSGSPGLDDKLVLIASPAERAQVDAFLRHLGPLAERVVVPKTTVGQMMAVLSATRLLVCNDSAPLHIAIGFDRPVVAIFGPTDPHEVGPYRRLDSVVQPEQAKQARLDYRAAKDDPSLIAHVSVDDVWEKVQANLA